jgi:uncharacterized repeat protein (TIGR03803 family)
MTELNRWKMAATVFALCIATVTTAPSQTFKTLADFNGTNGNGSAPAYMALAQGTNGNLYGTTETGGADFYNDGTIFQLTPTGTLTTTHTFEGTDGAGPLAGLLLALDGSFYGTTSAGGDLSCSAGNGFGCGTVFRITASGALTTLHAFEGIPNDGQMPAGVLLQATNGNIYGTTADGGAYGGGSIFKMSPVGDLTIWQSFVNEAYPYAGVIEGTNGDFYGTTSMGGFDCNSKLGCGTVYKTTSGGMPIILHTFCSEAQCADGAQPYANLVQGTGGDFYGTTTLGGDVTCNAPNGCGTVFKITAGGTLTTLHTFEGADGAAPYAGLIRATDGNFYGTTKRGGLNNDGTIFELTPDGVLTTLHSFSGTDGSIPNGGLLQATNGTLYGTTSIGGPSNDGTVFSFSNRLGPFVAFVRAAGKVGQTGGILGQGFTGTTAVSLNGIPANFKVISNTYLAVTVPAGATTGYVKVNTPTGVLTSNVPFHVIP